MDTVIYGGITVGTVVALLGGGLGVSIVAQVIKRVAGLNSSKVIYFMVAALSFAAAALADIIGAVHGNAALLGSHTVGVLGIANGAHTFIVSDADQFVSKVKVALGDEAAKTPSPSVPLNDTPASDPSAPPAGAGDGTPAAAPPIPPAANF